ncbi:hypothetical protein [Streptomyces griseorubiginosus]|uniref:hypothetical protein n=1 Tax=Streptomyces griseorubiginosus TaxID=67304 RepID=UPI002E80B7FE|nr:hypothetical protein [Streptomyces griseorubiginosus]WUB44613.1 hypothetical protein OHN19_15195 [Streptomyces griseorubiginosus]WUB53130.1 hypothetical protein OG942_15190 [Streptomyces griseorubiginosus]
MSGATDIDDPAALNRAGTGARETAGQTRTAGAHPVDETRSAARDFSGGNWNGGLGGALSGLTQTWSSQVSALAAKCDSLAGQCGGSGLLYQNTEAANTQTMRSMSAGSSPFG